MFLAVLRRVHTAKFHASLTNGSLAHAYNIYKCVRHKVCHSILAIIIYILFNGEGPPGESDSQLALLIPLVFPSQTLTVFH